MICGKLKFTFLLKFYKANKGIYIYKTKSKLLLIVMANFLSTPPLSATDGERAFYNRIKYLYLGEDHLIGYFEPDIGGIHPDFLLLSPIFGIIIVEIKDYSEKYLKTMAKSGKWERLKDDTLIFLDNPFDQIYQYWRVIKDRIDYCHFPKNIEIPIIRLVVFSKIPHDGHIAEEIRKIVPAKIHLCFKNMLNRNEKFKEYFNDILPSNLELHAEYFNLLRANIIPTCRLPTQKQTDLLEYFTHEEKVKLLDQDQEKFARELGEGHRLIFGVAGSGKTILLLARARILAKRHPDWKFLILCYNKLLKKLLFNLLNPQDYEADITISTFHGWARNYILNIENEFSMIYKKAEEKAKKEEKMYEFFQDFVPNLLSKTIEALGDTKIEYNAILIDEAQDFDESWFLPLMQTLNLETNSLLITCDGLQGIYARKRFYWSDVGIQARGRVKKFRNSYRTPLEIGYLAQETLPENLKELIDKFDEFLSTDKFLGAHGTVEIAVSENRDDEYKNIVNKIGRLLKNPQEILVLFKYNMAKIDYDHLFCRYLEDSKIMWKNLQDYNYNSPGLLIGTLHGTKGLESDTIIIPEIDTYKSDRDRQLLYVGITRSRKKIILSASKSTELIKSLEQYQT